MIIVRRDPRTTKAVDEGVSLILSDSDAARKIADASGNGRPRAPGARVPACDRSDIHLSVILFQCAGLGGTGRSDMMTF